MSDNYIKLEENTIQHRVQERIKNTTENTIVNTTENSVRDSVENSVRDSVENSVRDSAENSVRDSIENTIEKEPLQECLFCFEDVNPKKSYIGCDTCGKICHFKCYMNWLNRKNSVLCISCQQPTLVLSETKSTMISACLYNIFGSKKKFYKKFYRLS